MAKQKLLLDYELDRVPSTNRRNMWAITAVLMAWVINPTPAIVGGDIAAGLPLGQAITAILIGAIVIGLYSFPLGVAGAREGWSTALLARISFGEKGANLVSLAMAIANIIFYGVVVGIFVATLEAVLGMEPGSFMVGGGIIFVIIMSISALFGFRGVSLLSYISVIPMLLLFAYAAFLGVAEGGGWSNLFTVTPENPITFAEGITMTIGIFIVGATLAPDVTRYSKTGKESGLSTSLAFGLGFFLFVILGAIAVKGTGTGDLISIIVQSNIMWIGVILLIVSSWTSADNNNYSAGLALSKVFKLPKVYFTVLTVVIGGIIAATGVYNNLQAYLGIISLLIPPIGGIISVDYFLVKRRHTRGEVHISDYNIKAIVSWLVAVILDYVTALQLGIGASGINGLIVGSALYYILNIGRTGSTNK